MAVDDESRALVIDLMAGDPVVARLMNERKVGRLVVVGDETDTALGVISDSDLVRAFGL